MVGSNSCAVNFILPICVSKKVLSSISWCSVSIICTPVTHIFIIATGFPISTFQSTLVLYKIHEFISAQHIQLISHSTYRYISIIRNSRLHIFASFLSGNNNNTIRSTATIDCCSRCVFQHRKAFNIIRIYKV